MPVSLAVLLACSTPAPEAPGPTEPAPDGPATADMEMQVKTKVRMPTDRRVDPIDWVTAFKRQRVDLATLPAESRARVKKSNVPVLLPSDPELLSNCSVFVGDGWYAATLQAEGYQLLIRGTRIAHTVDLSQKEKDALGKAEDLRITRTEGIVTASFSLFGAAYNLEIECEGGDTNAACATDERVLELSKNLGFAGGKE